MAHGGTVFHLLAPPKQTRPRLRQSFKPLHCATRIVLRHFADRLRHPRGTRLPTGNALIGRLLPSLHERGVALMTRTTVSALERDAAGAVSSLSLEHDGQVRRARVRGGEILAGGGVNRPPQRRAERLPGIDAAWSGAHPAFRPS